MRCAISMLVAYAALVIQMDDGRGDRAVVIQSRPGAGPVVVERRTPLDGVILRWSDGSNRATIIQGR